MYIHILAPFEACKSDGVIVPGTDARHTPPRCLSMQLFTHGSIEPLDMLTDSSCPPDSSAVWPTGEMRCAAAHPDDTCQ